MSDEVETAVVVLVRDGKLAAVYNANWGAFTLPMTKRREEGGPFYDSEPRLEPIETTAVRAAAEALGRPLRAEQLERQGLDLQPISQSDRENLWKRYAHSVFVLRIENDPCPVDGTAWVWLKPDDVGALAPISPTLHDIVLRLQDTGFAW